jgi:uncharacterized protein YuzE
MKVVYDRETDILTIIFAETPVVDVCPAGVK